MGFLDESVASFLPDTHIHTHTQAQVSSTLSIWVTLAELISWSGSGQAFKCKWFPVRPPAAATV